MSVAADIAINVGLFTPFMQDVRGGAEGKSPVGTLHIDQNVTGDGSGGIAQITMSATRIMFGFRAILAPTLIQAFDDLATPEEVRLQFGVTGNRRIGQGYEDARLAIAASGGNFTQFQPSGIIIESDTIAALNVLSWTWSTNTNAKVYRGRMFASVFDAELIEAQGSISDFLAGVR